MNTAYTVIYHTSFDHGNIRKRFNVFYSKTTTASIVHKIDLHRINTSTGIPKNTF